MTDLGLVAGLGVQQAGVGVGHEVGDGLLRVGLGGADEAHGAATDPAGGIQAGQRLAVLAEDAAALVGDDVPLGVEGQALDGAGGISDGAVDGLDGPVAVLAGAGDVAVAGQAGALGAQADDVAVVVGEDLVGRREEVDVDAVGGGEVLRLLHRVPLKGLDDLALLVGGGQGRLRALVVLEVLLVDEDVDVGLLAELAQLQRGELHLSRTAATEDVHVGDRGLLERGGHVRGDLGGHEVVGVLGQDAGDVQRDVADADDGDLLGTQVPGTRVVGVTVVPRDEVGAAVALGGVDAGNVEGGVGVGSGGEDDGVIVLLELGHRDVTADLDVADEPNVPALEDLVEGHDDLLDARVVGGDAVAHQPVGRRKPLEQVDTDLHARLREDVRGVDACGACSDDGDIERTCVHCSSFLFQGTWTWHPRSHCRENRLLRSGATTAGYRATVYGGRRGLPQGVGNNAALSRVTSEWRWEREVGSEGGCEEVSSERSTRGGGSATRTQEAGEGSRRRSGFGVQVRGPPHPTSVYLRS